MVFINKKVFAIACLLIGLTACSSTEDESTRVADLPEVKSAFEPETLWSQSIDGVGHYFSRIKPYVAYGKVFTASRMGDAVAFDEKTGDEIWSIDLTDIKGERGFFDTRHSALLNGGPVAGGKKVFYGSENGILYTLDAETGELLWQANVKGEIVAAPAYDNNIVVVNTVSGILKAFDANSGETLWEVDQEVPPLSLRGTSAPEIAAGGVIVGTANGFINVYLADKGQPGWTAEVGEPTGSTELERVIDVDSKPVVVIDKVYSISARGNLVAIELRSGRVLWQRQYSSYRQLSIDGNMIYLTDVKGHVYGVDRINGLEKWSQASLTNRQVTGAAVLDDYVVVGDFEGYLHWLNKETGEFVAQSHVDSSGIYATPTAAKNVLYVQTRDGDVEAIQAPKK
ncbi:MAG: outer membrane protein assembly factor BamB [Thalassotalea sp.]